MAAIGFVAAFGVVGQVVSANVGAWPAFSDQFYSTIYMMPWFHLPVYIMGVSMCLAYHMYILDRQFPAQEAPRITKVFTWVRNSNWRYAIYVAGMFFICLAFFGLYPYMRDESSWSLGTQGMYAAFAPCLFTLGLACWFLPALLGKAEFIRFFFGGEFWLLFSNMTYCVFLIGPFFTFWFYLSEQHPIYVDNYVMVYYWMGETFFSLLIGWIFQFFFNSPFQALFEISRESKRAKQITKLPRAIRVEGKQVVNSDSMSSGLLREDS